MTCYTADTIHQNSSSNNSPCDTPTRSISLQLLNSNCNNNSRPAESSSPLDRSPSPNFGGIRPSRPMSLSLTTVDKVNTSASIKRPLSLGINILQEPQVTSPTESKTNQMTLTLAEATPPSEQESVTLAQAKSDSNNSSTKPNNIQSDCSSPNTDNVQVVLREKKSPTNKTRPRSMALPENTTPKEHIQLPSTPTTDRLQPAYNTGVANSLGVILASAVYSDSEQRKSRSLEDMYLLDHKVCRGCLSDSSCQCSNTATTTTAATTSKLTINQSNTSLSSQGSHSSLHGSLEIVQVS